VTWPRRAAVAAAALAAALATGCGEDQRATKVVVTRVMPVEQVERYAPTDPVRTLLELVQAAQHNDPTALRQRLTSQWGATPERLVVAMPTIRRFAQAFGTPRIVAVHRGPRRAAIDMVWGAREGTFILVPAKRGWRLSRILTGGRRLRVAGIISP
jgi:hypothetical protein